MSFFFFNDTATTEIYTLSLHDALPISGLSRHAAPGRGCPEKRRGSAITARPRRVMPRPAERKSSSVRSEEHTSELQSRPYLVCRPLLEKKKKNNPRPYSP